MWKFSNSFFDDYSCIFTFFIIPSVGFSIFFFACHHYRELVYGSREACGKSSILSLVNNIINLFFMNNIYHVLSLNSILVEAAIRLYLSLFHTYGSDSHWIDYNEYSY